MDMPGGDPTGLDAGAGGGIQQLLMQLLQGAGQGGASLLSQLIPGANAASPSSPVGGGDTNAGPVDATVPPTGSSFAPLGFGAGLARSMNAPGTTPLEPTGAGAVPSDVRIPPTRTVPISAGATGPAKPGVGGTAPLPPWDPALGKGVTPPAAGGGIGADTVAAPPPAANNAGLSGADLLKLIAAGAVKAPPAPPPIPVTGVAGGLHPAAAAHMQPPGTAQLLSSLINKRANMIPALGSLIPGRG